MLHVSAWTAWTRLTDPAEADAEVVRKDRADKLTERPVFVNNRQSITNKTIRLPIVDCSSTAPQHARFISHTTRTIYLDVLVRAADIQGTSQAQVQVLFDGSGGRGNDSSSNMDRPNYCPASLDTHRSI